MGSLTSLTWEPPQIQPNPCLRHRPLSPVSGPITNCSWQEFIWTWFTAISRADDGHSYQHCALPAMFRPWGWCPVYENTASTGVPLSSWLSIPKQAAESHCALAVTLGSTVLCDEFILSQPKLSGPPAFPLISSLDRTHLSSLQNWHTAIRFISLKGKRNSSFTKPRMKTRTFCHTTCKYSNKATAEQKKRKFYAIF